MFLQSDPLGFIEGVNAYAYASNDPINRSDPFGTTSQRIATGSAYPGAVAATAASQTISSGTQSLTAAAGRALVAAGEWVASASAVTAGTIVAGVAAAVYSPGLGGCSNGVCMDMQMPGAGSGGRIGNAGGPGTGDPCQSLGACSGGSTGSPGPGKWVNTTESMSSRAADYQTQITGRPANQSYVVNNVKFDGYNGTSLLDAKGPGYAKFVGPSGRFESYFGGRQSIVTQAQRQLEAANGTPIQWHVAEPEADQAIRTLLNDKDVSGIRVINTLPK